MKEPVNRQHSNSRIRAKARTLAEAIILQSMEDLWTPQERRCCRRFFGGEGFRICAEIAGLNTLERFRFLHLIGGKDNGRNTRIH